MITDQAIDRAKALLKEGKDSEALDAFIAGMSPSSVATLYDDAVSDFNSLAKLHHEQDLTEAGADRNLTVKISGLDWLIGWLRAHRIGKR